jgi:hypothetical protein
MLAVADGDARRDAGVETRILDPAKAQAAEEQAPLASSNLQGVQARDVDSRLKLLQS